MADPVFSPNVVATSHRAAALAIVNFMIANGHTHRASGRGNQGGFSVIPGNNLWLTIADLDQHAWIVLQQPAGGAAPWAGTRQICIQLGGTEIGQPVGHNARVKISPAIPGATGFVGGAPSPTVTPTATDQQVVGPASGTDAVPVYGLFLGSAGAENTYRTQMMLNANAPFGFLVECYPAGGGNTNFCFKIDPGQTYYTAASAGAAAVANPSYAVEDLDPYVYYVGPDLAAVGSFGTYSSGPQGFLGKIVGQPGTWQRIVPEVPFSQSINTVGALGTNAHNGKNPLRPFAYSRLAAQGLPAGPKSESYWLKWRSSVLSTGSTLTVAVALDRLIAGDTATLWGGAVPLV
jgi:hypothetical protein